MIKHYEIIKEPIITEKSNQLIETSNTYTFKVDKRANKIQIKNAIEAIFNVTVLRVNTINVRKKFKRVGQHSGYTAGYKKAMVTILDGQSIDAFEM